jgi:hypothetical protein
MTSFAFETLSLVVNQPTTNWRVANFSSQLDDVAAA